MDTIRVTPPMRVWGDGAARTIAFPPWETMVPVDAKLARIRGEGRIAPPDFERRVARLLAGQRVDLTGQLNKGKPGGQLRFGAGFVLVNAAVRRWPWLGKFDAGHPTRGDHLTPPAGLVEDLPPSETAWKELCEEFVPASCDRRFTAPWRMEKRPLLPDRAKAYAAAFGRTYLENEAVRVTETVGPTHWTVTFGDVVYRVLVEFEPDTSSVELLWTGQSFMPNGWGIVDGEILPSGKWRDQPIVFGYPLTTKALAAIAAAQAMRGA